MPDPQPEATTTAARVLPLSDEEIERIRGIHVRTVDDPDYGVGPYCPECGDWPCERATLLASVDAAVTARQQAERLHAAARYLGGEIEKERQARERAEAALAMAEGERDHWRMVAERTVADLTEERELRDFYQSQAAPHEPPQEGEG